MGMTGDSEHPTYPNPTVVDALCHIDFEPSSEGGWQISRPTKFLQMVSDEYPNMNPVSVPTVSLSTAGSELRFGGALRLSNDNGNRYIAVGDKHFIFGHRQGYPGWNKFRERLFDGWSKFITAANPRHVSRIGLRYVNIIPRTDEHPLISDWLSPTTTIPETLIRSKSDPFVLRLESWIEKNSLLIVSIGLVAPSLPNKMSNIIFDIDRLTVVNTDPNPDSLMQQFDLLHTDVWREFASARTPRLEAHLQGATS
jgi:uncharacterized protein (TIGR04255 family)